MIQKCLLSQIPLAISKTECINVDFHVIALIWNVPV